jgi:uncharacterized membrane protein
MTTILAIAVLVVGAINLLHWRWRGDERFHYDPRRRWMRIIFIACNLPFAILFLAGAISVSVYLGIWAVWSIADNVYAIARRQRERHKLLSSC